MITKEQARDLIHELIGILESDVDLSLIDEWFEDAYKNTENRPNRRDDNLNTNKSTII